VADLPLSRKVVAMSDSAGGYPILQPERPSMPNVLSKH
jgi:hypothetical protein